MEIEHDRRPHLIDDAACAPVLHRYIEVVAVGGGHSDVTLISRIRQESIKRQVKEVLRNTSICQTNFSLHGRQASNFALGNWHPGGHQGALSLDEKAVGCKYIVIIKASLPDCPVRVIYQVTDHIHLSHLHIH
ncbi:hypothetical protein ES703_120305 [subsurface metagenome]